MPRPRSFRHHPDLFTYQDLQLPIVMSERTELLTLLSALLAETLVAVAEVGADDEDRA